MATTAQIEAALSRLRAARAKLFETSLERTAAVSRRTRANLTIDELNLRIADARAEVLAANTEVRALLAEQETWRCPRTPTGAASADVPTIT